MRHVNVTAFDCPDAWFKVLKSIWTEGDVFQVGYGSEETETKKLNLTLEITQPENRPLLSDKAPCDMAYVQWYALTYLWCGAEGKKDETYTYGSRLREPVDQVEEAIKRYLKEQRDRQVTMVVRLPDDILKISPQTMERMEPPCLSLIDTEVFDGRVHLTCYFRSWDAFGGLPANVAGLQLFNEAFVSEINERGNLSLKTGKLIFHSKNCHIYKRQYNLVKELLEPKDKPSRMAKAIVKEEE
jgi:thymidylate synthase